MRKYTALCALFTLVVLQASFAKGTKESDYQKVEGKDNWQHTYDISSLPDGKYNLIVEGKDNAGNTAVAGPYNVYVDPKSDLPVTTISNPTSGTRVGGDIHIVGTCVDDDAVDKVEISMDGGEYASAEGKDFWSYSVEAGTLADGRHTVNARGVDVNGVTGNTVSVFFNLDTKKPIVTVTSFASGTIVSGKASIAGSVDDANGIRAMAFSTDGRKTFKDLSIRASKDGKSAQFALDVDTKKLTDGPYVYWFRGTDLTGSVGYTAFLIFVDNTGPVLDILSPVPEEKASGKAWVVGKITESIGVKALTFDAGEGGKGSIELIPGNPYWAHEFDFSRSTASSVKVSFTVTDLVGNTTTKQVAVGLVQGDGDLPVVTLRSPVAAGKYGAELVLSGSVRDDDGVKAIQYAIDGKAPVTVEVKEAFSLNLSDIVPGAHTMAVKGVDVYGKPGKDVTVSFTFMGKPPVVTLEGVVQKKGVIPFTAGAEIARDQGASLTGKIVSAGQIASAELTLGNAAPEKLTPRKGDKAGESLFDIKIPATVAYGVVPVTVRAKDQFGQEASYRSLIHVTNYTARNVEPGVLFFDSRILPDGSVTISAEEPLVGICAGAEINGVTLDPLTDVVGVAFDGDRITVSPRQGGTSPAVRVKVLTSKGHQLFSSPLTFTVAEGRIQPIAIAEVSTGKDSTAFYPGMRIGVDKTTVLKGSITTADAVKSADFSLLGGAPKSLSLKRADKTGPYTFELPIPAELPYGRVDLKIGITKDTGRQELTSAFFRVDAAGDAAGDAEGIYFEDSRIDKIFTLLSPGDTLSGYFNGRPVKDVTLERESKVVSASFEGNRLILTAAEEGVSENVRLKVTTVDGDMFQSDTYVIRVDAAPPALTVLSPQTGDWLGSAAVLKGTVGDASGIRKIEYSLGSEDAFTAVTAVKSGDLMSFEIPLSLQGIADGDVVLVVRAEDNAGKTASSTLRFMKDSEGPAISILTPGAADAVNGTITVTGTAKDSGVVVRMEMSDDGKTWSPVTGTTVFTANVDLSKYQKAPDKFSFRATDSSGNQTVLAASFNMEQTSDVPVVQIQIPQDGEVLRSDFTVSGMVFDDDGVGKITYRIDGGNFTEVTPSNSFSIPIKLDDIADNEHVIEVKAEDVNGVPSVVQRSTFKISKAEPSSRLVSPALTTTVKGIVPLTGESTDKNGISEVYVSFDNGRTFNLAEGKEKWVYKLDTRILKGGTYSLFIKAIDGFGTEGFFTTLLNIDNDGPQIIVDKPIDGDVVTDTLTLDGRAWDNIILTSLKAALQPLSNGGKAAAAPASYDLPLKGAFAQAIDLSGYAPGWYNLTIEGVDKANNSVKASRNIFVQEKKAVDRVDIFFPVGGETLSGSFTLAGMVQTTGKAQEVSFSVDGQVLTSVPVNDRGYFSSTVTPDQMADGVHSITVSFTLPGGLLITSEAHSITFRKNGPWIRITSHMPGDYLTLRPYIKGEAGWISDAVDPADKEAAARAKKEQDTHKVDRVEISMDNGKIFLPVQGKEKWQYRVETQSYPDGEIRLIMRAVFADGSMAYDETKLTIDDTPPQVVILAPTEEGRFNSTIALLGTAKDENGITEVRAAVRKGDKTAYEVPGFIQGLYFDGHAFGATDWEFGLGLTFFSDNVKLQASVGHAPQYTADVEQSFWGTVIGAKLLANVFHLPFSSFLGPDWDWLSLSVGLGTAFMYVLNAEWSFTGPGTMVGEVMGQLEFPIIKINTWPAFRTYSFYSEVQMWIISSDVSPRIFFRPGFGVRIGLF